MRRRGFGGQDPHEDERNTRHLKCNGKTTKARSRLPGPSPTCRRRCGVTGGTRSCQWWASSCCARLMAAPPCMLLRGCSRQGLLSGGATSSFGAGSQLGHRQTPAEHRLLKCPQIAFSQRRTQTRRQTRSVSRNRAGGGAAHHGGSAGGGSTGGGAGRRTAL